MIDQYQDGNALAGPLREVFAVDMTTAIGTCATCRRAGPVATLRVYSREPGFVARCPACDEIVLRYVRGPSTAWLDVRGAVNLQIQLPPDNA